MAKPEQAILCPFCQSEWGRPKTAEELYRFAQYEILDRIVFHLINSDWADKNFVSALRLMEDLHPEWESGVI